MRDSVASAGSPPIPAIDEDSGVNARYAAGTVRRSATGLGCTVTEKEWTEEIERAVAGACLPCRVHAAWMEHKGPMCYAELTDTRSGKERMIRLSRTEFTTVNDRRAEIVRQVQNLQK